MTELTPPWGREREAPTPETLTWLCVQSARIEEFGGEVDVDVTEKEKDVASFPEAGSHIKALSPRKFSVQLDEGKIPEVGSSEREDQIQSLMCSHAQAERFPWEKQDQGPSTSCHVGVVTMKTLRLPRRYKMTQTHWKLPEIKGTKNTQESFSTNLFLLSLAISRQ